MKKILLATGCSYTNPKYKPSDPAFGEDFKLTMWPEIVADKLDLECINKGLSGKGNGFMLDTIIDSISTYGERIDTVMVLWSGYDRLKLLHMYTNSIFEIFLDGIMKDIEASGKSGDPFKWMDEMNIGRVSRNYWKSGFPKKYLIDYMIEDSLRSMATVHQICAANNIKLVTAQGVDPFSFHFFDRYDPETKSWLRDHVFKQLLKNPNFGMLSRHKENMIGFPGWKTFNGYSIDDLRYNDVKNNYFQKGKDYNLSSIDLHPSQEAQEIIAQIYYDQWRKIYA